MKKTRKQAVVKAAKAAVIMGMLPLATHVQALEYQVSEDLKVNVDTSLAYGRMWRVEGRSKNMIGYSAAEVAALGDPNRKGEDAYYEGVQKLNSDDGDRNFDKGDVVSSRFAGVMDIDVSYKNVGFFLRPQAYYDEVPFGKTSWTDKYVPNTINESANNGLAGGAITDTSHWTDDYKNSAGHKARFLDAYVYGSFPIGDRTLQMRIGRQTISWGEALMLQGGIAFAQNRLDATAATSPGVELKEIFLPTGAVYGQMNISESNTIEAYWQYEWIPSTLFPTGSYFSGHDFIDGDTFITDPAKAVPGSTSRGNMARVEHDPSNSDQWGLAFRHLMGEGTEAALYIVNYTDKLPMFWGTNGAAKHMSAADYNLYRDSIPSDDPLDPLYHPGQFGINYFEDIHLYGLTLNTVVYGVQLGVEYAYRANAPIVPACTIEKLAVAGACRDRSYETIANSGGVGLDPNDPVQAAVLTNFKNAATYSWPNRAEIHTLNLGITYIFQPNPLWDTATLVGELGSWYIGSGYENDDLRFAHLGGFTKYGEGMSAQFMPEYKNVMEGVDLTIPFFMNYGIDGSLSTFNYNEHSLWASVGAEAVYLEHWRFATYYNRFSGKNNLWQDRDNVSFNVKYIF
ncbi:MAG TPA: DUF1302 family protein [Pseudomonadales bacterium]|nr:DUF1302 family protein [Pseudomonadales bacterium]